MGSGIHPSLRCRVRAAAGSFIFVDFEHGPDGGRTCLACPIGTQFDEWCLSFSFADGGPEPSEPSLTWSLANPAAARWDWTVDFAKTSSRPFDSGRKLGTTRMDVVEDIDTMTFDVLVRAALSPQVRAFDRVGESGGASIDNVVLHPCG